MNVASVLKCSQHQVMLSCMREYILERNLICVQSVEEDFHRKEIGKPTRLLTLKERLSQDDEYNLTEFFFILN